MSSLPSKETSSTSPPLPGPPSPQAAKPMGSKRRARSRPPQPSPPKKSADTTDADQEGSRRAAAAKKQQKNSQPRPSTAAAAGADSLAVHSLDPASRSTTKSAAPASQVESDGDLIPEPAPKKAKASKKSKTVQVLEAAPSVSGKQAPEAAPSKADAKKKANVQVEKAAPAATRPGKAEQLEKSGVVKEIATENGNASRKGKGKGRKADKVALTANQNGVGATGTEEKTDEEDAEGGVQAQATPRSFEELQNLYPNLAVYVEMAQADHPCPETVKRAFGLIGDVQGKVLESKFNALRSLEVQGQMQDEDIRKNILKMLSDLAKQTFEDV